MVVDDEYDIIFSLQAGLVDGGYDVDAFTDPELALSSFKPGLYDLVLIDNKMPKIDDLYHLSFFTCRTYSYNQISFYYFLRSVPLICEELDLCRVYLRSVDKGRGYIFG